MKPEKKWTPQLDKTIEEEYLKAYRIEDIADKIGRRVEAVEARLCTIAARNVIRGNMTFEEACSNFTVYPDQLERRIRNLTPRTASSEKAPPEKVKVKKVAVDLLQLVKEMNAKLDMLVSQMEALNDRNEYRYLKASKDPEGGH